MNNKISIATISLWLIGACSTEPTPGESTIELRSPTRAPIGGTAFSCTEHPPEVFTPCDLPHQPTDRLSGTGVYRNAKGSIVLSLTRKSSAADAGGVALNITLQFRRGGVIGATAKQEGQFFSGDRSHDRLPLSGWIEPVIASPAPEDRNAGRFSVTFDWGTVSGSYDTAN